MQLLDVNTFFFFFLFKLPKHYLHYLQYKAITGATYNDTIYIIYITKQYGYLFNLQYNYALLTKIYEYIGYLHSYCNSEQQNKLSRQSDGITVTSSQPIWFVSTLVNNGERRQRESAVQANKRMPIKYQMLTNGRQEFEIVSDHG